MSNYYQRKDALGNAGPYLVSGKPFAKGGLTVNQSAPVKVEFPAVTRWVQISNNLRVAFSEAGLSAGGTSTNYFVVDAGTVFQIEVKVTEIYLSGDNGNVAFASVVAGLTDIATSKIVDNWSGSIGVG